MYGDFEGFSPNSALFGVGNYDLTHVLLKESEMIFLQSHRPRDIYINYRKQRNHCYLLEIGKSATHILKNPQRQCVICEKAKLNCKHISRFTSEQCQVVF